MKHKIILFVLLVITIIVYMLYKHNNKLEPFTLNINKIYHPYKRNIRDTYESFMNNYGSERIYYFLRKWNIF